MSLLITCLFSGRPVPRVSSVWSVRASATAAQDPPATMKPASAPVRRVRWEACATTAARQARGATTARGSASATTTPTATPSVGRASARLATVEPSVKKVSPAAAFVSCVSGEIARGLDRHTPSIAFRHLPPNSARFSYATKGALFISAQLSTDAVSALRNVRVLI